MEERIITPLTPPVLDAFRVDFQKVASQFAEKRGLQLSLGVIRYDPAHATCQLDVRVLDVASGAVIGSSHENRRVKSLLVEAGVNNVPDDPIGKVAFCFKGNRYKVVGFNSRAPRYPIQLEDCVTGRRSRSSARFLQTF